MAIPIIVDQVDRSLLLPPDVPPWAIAPVKEADGALSYRELTPEQAAAAEREMWCEH